MSHQTRRHALLIVALTLSLAACRIPLSEHPLSDAANSTVDERLIGDWEVDFTPINAKMGRQSDEVNKAVYRIARGEGKAGGLISWRLEDGKPSDETAPLLTTHLAMHDFFTWGPFERDQGKPFAICMYELDDDHGKVYVMDDAYVIKLIETEHTPGKIDRGSDGQVQGVMLAGDTKQLGKLIERHGRRCFDMKHPIICRRIKPSVDQQQGPQH